MNPLDYIRTRLHRPLSCEQVNQFILDYLEDRLAPPIRRAFETHLERCPNCHAYLDQYRETVTLVHDAAVDQPAPPPELVETTLSFLRAHYEDA